MFDATKAYTLKFSGEQLEVLINAVQQVAYIHAAPIMFSIQQQIENSIKEDRINAESKEKKAKT